MRVMPAAPSREPSARRAWSIRSSRVRLGRARSLAARTWAGHRLFIIVAIPAILLRVDAELGYRWQAWFNDSFEYVPNTVHFKLDPTRTSGYSIASSFWNRFIVTLLITILQHLMGLAVAVMIYALARHRFGVRPWLATLAVVPVLYDGFEIELEHLIMADVPFLFLLYPGGHAAALGSRGPVAAHVRGHRRTARHRSGLAVDRHSAARGLRRAT